jgi:hypothetical protein
MRRPLRLIGGVVGAAVAVYGVSVAVTYFRSGRAVSRAERHPLLDRFMPEPEVRERHATRVAAPAEITLRAARRVSFHDSVVARALLALRALPARIRSGPPPRIIRRPILGEVLALGWRPLAETSEHLVMGAVTQPWKSEVRFRGLPPEEFAAFREPGYAKIVWTFEVDPIGPASSVFATETRVVTTDPTSRERFRRYWACLSPGILLIRHAMLRLVRAEAERAFADLADVDRSSPTPANPG